MSLLHQASANDALALHNHELEPELRLNVYISNPERKKDRSDASANAREVYVAGLSRFVTDEDLKKLFKAVRSLCFVHGIEDSLIFTTVWTYQRYSNGNRSRGPLKRLRVCGIRRRSEFIRDSSRV